MKLTVELVPQTCWFSNVRSMVKAKEWDKIRHSVYAKFNHCCAVCGGKGSRHPVECHEVWHYCDVELKQTLVDMVALCPRCHEVKHIGLAEVRGRLEQAADQYALVNGCTKEEAEAAFEAAFQQYRLRSEHQWELDISLLKREYGIVVSMKQGRH